jgi:hypothetical protein
MFGWFDSAGVEEIPPLFVGEVVEKFDLAETTAADARPGRCRHTVQVMTDAVVSNEPSHRRDRLRRRWGRS